MTLVSAQLTSYTRTAVRALYRDRFYASVNVFGLALGMACCLLIALFVIDEFSYDRWMPKSERIFRLVTPKGGSSHRCWVRCCASCRRWRRLCACTRD